MEQQEETQMQMCISGKHTSKQIKEKALQDRIKQCQRERQGVQGLDTIEINECPAILGLK